MKEKVSFFSDAPIQIAMDINVRTCRQKRGIVLKYKGNEILGQNCPKKGLFDAMGLHFALKRLVVKLQRGRGSSAMPAI